MESLAMLRDACVVKSFKSFKDIQPGDYIVTFFDKTITDHGERVRVTMDDGYMYLPHRFNKLPQEVLDDLNKTPKIMIYGGKDPSARNRLIIDFKDTATYYTDMFTDSEIYG